MSIQYHVTEEPNQVEATKRLNQQITRSVLFVVNNQLASPVGNIKDIDVWLSFREYPTRAAENIYLASSTAASRPGAARILILFKVTEGRESETTTGSALAIRRYDVRTPEWPALVNAIRGFLVGQGFTTSNLSGTAEGQLSNTIIKFWFSSTITAHDKADLLVHALTTPARYRSGSLGASRTQSHSVAFADVDSTIEPRRTSRLTLDWSPGSAVPLSDPDANFFLFVFVTDDEAEPLPAELAAAVRRSSTAQQVGNSTVEPGQYIRMLQISGAVANDRVITYNANSAELIYRFNNHSFPLSTLMSFTPMRLELRGVVGADGTVHFERNIEYWTWPGRRELTPEEIARTTANFVWRDEDLPTGTSTTSEQSSQTQEDSPPFAVSNNPAPAAAGAAPDPTATSTTTTSTTSSAAAAADVPPVTRPPEAQPGILARVGSFVTGVFGGRAADPAASDTTATAAEPGPTTATTSSAQPAQENPFRPPEGRPPAASEGRRFIPFGGRGAAPVPGPDGQRPPATAASTAAAGRARPGFAFRPPPAAQPGAPPPAARAASTAAQPGRGPADLPPAPQPAAAAAAPAPLPFLFGEANARPIGTPQVAPAAAAPGRAPMPFGNFGAAPAAAAGGPAPTFVFQPVAPRVGPAATVEAVTENIKTIMGTWRQTAGGAPQRAAVLAFITEAFLVPVT